MQQICDVSVDYLMKWIIILIINVQSSMIPSGILFWITKKNVYYDL